MEDFSPELLAVPEITRNNSWGVAVIWYIFNSNLGDRKFHLRTKVGVEKVPLLQGLWLPDLDSNQGPAD